VIRHEQISVSGTVLYCDGDECYVKGPSTPYDDADTVIEEAAREGWHLDDEDAEGTMGDLCPACVAKANLVDPEKRKRAR
jgi:hypothetical protein